MPPSPLDIHLKPKEYTLVLDLDETLVHFMDYTNKNELDDKKLKVRPGVKELFEVLDPYFKFVVFTAAMKHYADFVIERIDP